LWVSASKCDTNCPSVDTDSNANCNSVDTYSDPNRDSGDADSDGDSIHTDTNSSDANANAGYPDSHSDTFDPNAHPECHRYTYIHANGNSHRHSDPNTYVGVTDG
jgi:hypothetical protein